MHMTNVYALTEIFRNQVTDRTLEMLIKAVEKCRNERDEWHVLEWLMNPVKWNKPRVSIDTFIDSPEYLNVGENVYPEIRKMAREILENNHMEAIVVAGIGSGKSFLSQVLANYSTYTLLCMNAPHKFYKLTADKPITIMNMGPTATQAENVVFSGIKSLMENSPFFAKFQPRALSRSISFDREMIMVMPGNSRSTTPLGYNLFAGILDEAAFYLDTDEKDVAEDIYTGLQRRIVSRFGYDGLLVGISSPRYVDDFIMRKLKEGEKYTRTYARTMPTWKCVPKEKQDLAHRFYFNCRKGFIEETPPTDFGIVNKIEDVFDPNAEIWEIPGDYKTSFQQNPEKAKRDFGAVPSLTLQGFFPLPFVVRKSFKDDRPVPYDANNIPKLPEALRTSYFIHIDLALNKDGKGDAAGFCMAHFEDWHVTENGEKQKKVYVDLLMRILAGPLGKIDFEDIRQMIYNIRAQGYSIKRVTLDGFESEDFMQILNKKSIRAEYLSVDRTIDPYNTLKEVIYGDRLNCHPMEFAITELCRLEVHKSTKIDHPSGGSKDVADALCGAVYNVIMDGGSTIGVDGTSSYSPPDKNISLDGEKSEKVKYYERLIELKRRGLLPGQ